LASSEAACEILARFHQIFFYIFLSFFLYFLLVSGRSEDFSSPAEMLEDSLGLAGGIDLPAHLASRSRLLLSGEPGWAVGILRDSCWNLECGIASNSSKRLHVLLFIYSVCFAAGSGKDSR